MGRKRKLSDDRLAELANRIAHAKEVARRNSYKALSAEFGVSPSIVSAIGTYGADYSTVLKVQAAQRAASQS
jgi:hypothetical protein